MVTVTRASPFTYVDLRATPDDGHRYELLDGALIVTPSPGTAHQVCAFAVGRLLHQHRRQGDVVIIGPFDYVISEVTVLVPDVIVARREDLGTANLPATPLLVVEVASPSTRRIDGTAKRLAYEEAGVRACWLVDPGIPNVTVLELVDGRYEELAVVSGDQPFTTSLPFPVELTPARLLDDLG